MINFATLQGLTIPEGVVTQIADEQGNVIWSAVEKAIITLSGTPSPSYAEYKGTKYTVPATFEAAVGDTINLYCGDVPNAANIILNDTLVSQGQSNTTYSYTVVGDATIEVEITGSSYMAKAHMYITET